MSYQLLLRQSALAEFAKLPTEDYERVRDAMAALTHEPRPWSCFYLVGRDGWHLRVGNYRVVYKIDDDQQTITVIHIGRLRAGYY